MFPFYTNPSRLMPESLCRIIQSRPIRNFVLEFPPAFERCRSASSGGSRHQEAGEKKGDRRNVGDQDEAQKTEEDKGRAFSGPAFVFFASRKRILEIGFIKGMQAND
jgi:hypothetical protein